MRYLATARRWPGDAEWDARIAAHLAPPAGRVDDGRGAGRAGAVRAAADVPLLVDDLATWLTGVLDDAEAWERPEVRRRSASGPRRWWTRSAACRGRVVLVSAEVGLGVVPSTRAGRLFRDELGALNAALAAVCDEVLLLVAGLPLRLK